MTFYTPPMGVKNKWVAFFAAPVDTVIDAIELVGIKTGLATISDDIRARYGNGEVARLVDFLVSLTQPFTLIVLFLAFAVYAMMSPSIHLAGTIGKLSNPAPVSNAPVVANVPSQQSTATSAPTFTPMPTFTPTQIPSTATPTVAPTPSFRIVETGLDWNDFVFQGWAAKCSAMSKDDFLSMILPNLPLDQSQSWGYSGGATDGKFGCWLVFPWPAPESFPASGYYIEVGSQVMTYQIEKSFYNGLDQNVVTPIK